MNISKDIIIMILETGYKNRCKITKNLENIIEDILEEQINFNVIIKSTNNGSFGHVDGAIISHIPFRFIVDICDQDTNTYSLSINCDNNGNIEDSELELDYTDKIWEIKF